MFGTDIDSTIILREPIRLWQAFWIMGGFYIINYLLDMIHCEIKYEGGGEDFIQFGKKYVEKKCSNGNTPPIK